MYSLCLLECVKLYERNEWYFRIFFSSFHLLLLLLLIFLAISWRRKITRSKSMDNRMILPMPRKNVIQLFLSVFNVFNAPENIDYIYVENRIAFGFSGKNRRKNSSSSSSIDHIIRSAQCYRCIHIENFDSSLYVINSHFRNDRVAI